MKSFKINVSILAHLFPALALAGGVGWGNGEGGFSKGFPPLELPLDKPVQVTEIQCRLTFGDGLEMSLKQRLKKQGGDWCLYGMYPGISLLRQGRTAKWDCDDSLEDLMEDAIQDLDLGLRCEKFERNLKSGADFSEAYPLPPKNPQLREPQLLTENPFSAFYQVESKRIAANTEIPEAENWLIPILERAPSADIRLKDIRTVGARTFAYWLSYGISTDTSSRWRHTRLVITQSRDSKIFKLAIRDGKAKVEIIPEVSVVRTSAAMGRTSGELTYANTMDWFPVKRLLVPSADDLLAIQELEAHLNSTPVTTLLSFGSAAELIHFRTRNQRLLPEAIRWSYELLIQLRELSTPLDMRYRIYGEVLSEINTTTSHLSEGYRNMLTQLGTCEFKDRNLTASSYQDPDLSVFAEGVSSFDCLLMSESIVRIRDRLERLQFSFPDPIAPYDPAGCRYIVDIVSSLKDLHNRIFLFDDFPNSFFGTEYAKKITDTIGTLNRLKYRRASPSDLLGSVLPKWREICKPEVTEVSRILNEFRSKP